MRANILPFVRMFPRPFGARKNITQLTKYLHVFPLSSESSHSRANHAYSFLYSQTEVKKKSRNFVGYYALVLKSENKFDAMGKISHCRLPKVTQLTIKVSLERRMEGMNEGRKEYFYSRVVY